MSSEAFVPLRNENKQLSVSDSTKIRPDVAYYRYARDPEREDPIGVLGVRVSECECRGLVVRPVHYRKHQTIS